MCVNIITNSSYRTSSSWNGELVNSRLDDSITIILEAHHSQHHLQLLPSSFEDVPVHLLAEALKEWMDVLACQGGFATPTVVVLHVDCVVCT